MPYWTLVCLIIAIVAGTLGFGDVAGAADYTVTKVAFVVFLVLFLSSLIFGSPRPHA